MNPSRLIPMLAQSKLIPMLAVAAALAFSQNSPGQIAEDPHKNTKETQRDNAALSSRPINIVSSSNSLVDLPRVVADPYTQIRIEYDDGWHVSVYRLVGIRGLMAVDSFDCRNRSTVLFTGPPGDYLVFAVSQEAVEFQQLLTITPPGPGPDPDPDPDPDPTPNPDPPTPDPDDIPDTVPNEYGIGRSIYPATAQLPKGEVSALSTVIRDQLDKLSRQAITPVQFADTVRAKRESFPGKDAWTQWSTAAETLIVAAADKYGNSIAAFMRYYDELAKTMEIAVQ